MICFSEVGGCFFLLPSRRRPWVCSETIKCPVGGSETGVPQLLTLATEETRLTLNLWDEVWRGKETACIAQFRDGFLIESVGVSHLTVAHIHLFVRG